MHRHFELVEEELKERVLAMGRLVEGMIRSALEGLTQRRPEPLDDVARAEEQVNALHIDVDDRCLKLIALHQPAAEDLRFIIAALKINSDLERIGDQAVNIAETGTYLAKLPGVKLHDIPRMAELASGMLRDALAAFASGDVGSARSVIRRDDEEDRLKSETFNELVALMQSDASTIQRAMDIILIARNLERIADHATNIAEDVVFMVEGKDIRHHAEGKNVE